MAPMCKATLSPLLLYQLPSLLPTKKSDLLGENPSILVLFLPPGEEGGTLFPPGIKLLQWEQLEMGGMLTQ